MVELKGERFEIESSTCLTGGGEFRSHHRWLACGWYEEPAEACRKYVWPRAIRS